MGLYQIRRALPGITEEGLEAAAMRAAFCTYAFDGEVRWIRSYFDPQRSEIYCIYRARDPEQLRQHAHIAGIPADEIAEVRELDAERYYRETEAEAGASAASGAPEVSGPAPVRAGRDEATRRGAERAT